MTVTTIPTAGIADDAVGNTKLDLTANYAFTGTITGTKGLINVAQTTNDTRVSLSAATAYNFFSFNYDQQKANSKIRADVHVALWSASAGTSRIRFYYNGSEPSGQTGRSPYTYTAQNYNFLIQGTYFFTGDSSTGNKAILLSHDAANGASQKPAQIFNPNHLDDARQNHHVSYITISEYDI